MNFLAVVQNFENLKSVFWYHVSISSVYYLLYYMRINPDEEAIATNRFHFLLHFCFLFVSCNMFNTSEIV